MPKSRRKSSMITNLSKKTLPVVDKGLQKVGSTAKKVATSSIPVIEKGVSGVYGTMATGLDLSVKGVKAVTKSVRKGGSRRKRHTRRHTRRHKKH